MHSISLIAFRAAYCAYDCLPMILLAEGSSPNLLQRTANRMAIQPCISAFTRLSWHQRRVFHQLCANNLQSILSHIYIYIMYYTFYLPDSFLHFLLVRNRGSILPPSGRTGEQLQPFYAPALMLNQLSWIVHEIQYGIVINSGTKLKKSFFRQDFPLPCQARNKHYRR